MKNNTKMMVKSSIGLALCICSLLLFRGGASLISALFIPSILAVFTTKNSKTILFGIFAALTLITILFFTTQTVFIIIYVLLALNIKWFFPLIRKQKFYFPIYIGIISTSLYLGIRLTQWVFMVPLHSMMLRMSSGNIFIYALIIAAEGLLAGISHFLIVNGLGRRMKLPPRGF